MSNEKEIEIKDFQDETSFTLFDSIYQLGRSAILDYGERELGEFIISMAFSYRSRLFEIQQRKTKIEMLKAMGELKEMSNDEELDEVPDEELEEVFKNQKVH